MEEAFEMLFLCTTHGLVAGACFGAVFGALTAMIDIYVKYLS